MNRPTKIHLEIVTALAGLSACLVVCVGLYSSITGFVGEGSYSPVNHFVSQLGLSYDSTNAWYFNRSLMMGGLLLFIFVQGLGSYFEPTMKIKMARFTGMIASAAFGTVGYFTADVWVPHMAAASTFFFGAMMSVGLFTWVLWHDPQRRLHPSIAYQGIFITGSYLIALFWPKDLLFAMVYDPVNFVRPAIWMLPILEWVYCLMLATWISMVSVNLLYIALWQPNRQGMRSTP